MKKKRRMDADLTADEEQSRCTQLKYQIAKASFDDAVTDVHSKKSSTSTHETAASQAKNDKKRQLETAVSCEPNAATTKIYLETTCQKRHRVPSEGTAEAAQEETSRPESSSTNTCDVSDKIPVASVVSGPSRECRKWSARI